MMRIAKLIPLLMVVACSSGPSKEESVQIWASASAAMATAQQKAVDQARQTNVAPVTDLSLDWSGACSLGGTVGVRGNYSGEGSDDHAAFDLRTTFTGCHEVGGTLDGDVHWTSVANGTMFTATMSGGIDWSSSDGDASCDFDLTITLNATSVSYSGTLCGYDVGSEVHI